MGGSGFYIWVEFGGFGIWVVLDVFEFGFRFRGFGGCFSVGCMI